VFVKFLDSIETKREKENRKNIYNYLYLPHCVSFSYSNDDDFCVYIDNEAMKTETEKFLTLSMCEKCSTFRLIARRSLVPPLSSERNIAEADTTRKIRKVIY
jgi:hypothetical protein